MIRTPKFQPRNPRGLRFEDALNVFKAAREFYLRDGEEEYAADRFARVAVSQLRRATYRAADTTFILSTPNLRYIATTEGTAL